MRILPEHFSMLAERLDIWNAGIAIIIHGSVACYRGVATKPIRQMTAYADADKGNNSGEYQGKANAMAEHFASFHKVVGAYEMSHLHGESHGYSRIDATAKPCRRFHKSYCR